MGIDTFLLITCWYGDRARVDFLSNLSLSLRWYVKRWSRPDVLHRKKFEIPSTSLPTYMTHRL